MQKLFSTQPELFATASDLDNQILNSLDSTEELLDWLKIESFLAPIYATNTGRPSYPLLTLFRSLLLDIWYKLSDAQLAKSLYRDLLFREFFHLELISNVPEASTLGRFRNHLVELDYGTLC